MTEAEQLELELEALQLEKEQAEATKGPPPAAAKAPPLQVGAGETFINRAAEALPTGRPLVNALTALGMKVFRPSAGARLTPQAAAELGVAQEAPTPGLLDEYRGAREDFNRRTEAGAEAHPYAAGAGTLAGTALSLAAPLPKVGIGGKAAGKGLRVLNSALTAGGYGALNGVVNGKADLSRGEFGQAVKDAIGVDALKQAGQDFSEGHYGRAALDVLGAGAVGGTLAGGTLEGVALPLAKKALGGTAGRLVRGVSKRGDAAKELERLGVDTNKLTLGQLDPEGMMAQLEESGQHAMGSGNVIRGQRAAGNEAWRDAVLSNAQPPYQPLPAGTTADRLAAAHEGFGPIYEGIGRNPVATAGPGEQSVADQLRKSFANAAQSDAVIATDAERSALNRYLQNQASGARFQSGEANTVGELQKVRSNIRKELSSLLKGPSPDHASAQILRDAEEAVTQQIQRNLPASEQAALRVTDARYALSKTVEDAARRAGDNPEGLMPQHLSAAVKAATDRGGYARGAGGRLRELATAGREALQTKTPPTGVRALIQAAPGLHYATSPFAAIANTGLVKPFMLGETAAQQRLAALLDSIPDKLPRANPSRAGAALFGGPRLPLPAHGLSEEERRRLEEYANALRKPLPQELDL